jgi:hypothetical protein
MKGRILVTALLAIASIPGMSLARALSVDVSTNRGDSAVFQDGDRLEIKARASEDAYLMVYEIDAEGYVRLLFPSPDSRHSGFVEGDRTVRLPEENSRYELAVSGPVGEGYVVAIASRDPFTDPPWYLRPIDPRGEDLGYERTGADQDDEEGVTSEGRIVGDPFVAMERIRRRVLPDPEDRGSFATEYVTYYVHEQVKYPRYICNDCHRPGYWSWWDGFDPYYAQCSVFDFRVNWSWGWGPAYWNGFVPYYVYVYRRDCPPRYRSGYTTGLWHSSWDGWKTWRDRWGPAMRRTRTTPPANYVPPARWDRDQGGAGKRIPPGFIAGGGDQRTWRGAGNPRLGSGTSWRRADRNLAPPGGGPHDRRADPIEEPRRGIDPSWRRIGPAEPAQRRDRWYRPEPSPTRDPPHEDRRWWRPGLPQHPNHEPPSGNEGPRMRRVDRPSSYDPPRERRQEARDPSSAPADPKPREAARRDPGSGSAGRQVIEEIRRKTRP